MAEKRIVLLGPPGAGKGTQAQWLCDALDLPHLATGNILRSAIANNTPVGLKVKPFIEAGKLVPDEVVISVVEEAVETVKKEKQGAGGYILDGFPRTRRQGEALRDVLAKRKEKLDRVILINTPDEVVRERLEQRRSCMNPLCGAVYNVKSNPPKKADVCDLCGNALVIRDDDKPETIRSRQQQYWHDTAPLIDFYERASLLTEIDGTGSVHEVAGRILEAVAKIGRRSADSRRQKAIDDKKDGPPKIEPAPDKPKAEGEKPKADEKTEDEKPNGDAKPKNDGDTKKPKQ